MEPPGVGTRPVHREGGDLDLILLAPQQFGDGEESATAVSGDGLGPTSTRQTFLSLPPLELVAGQHAVLRLLRGRLPADNDGGGGGRLHRHVLRGVGRDIAVGPASDLLTVGSLAVLIVSRDVEGIFRVFPEVC